MKKRDKLVIVIIILLVLVIIVLGFIFFPNKTGKVIFTPPTDCSDASIKAVWNLIFQESSNGITILPGSEVREGTCVGYFAYKLGTTSYLMYGWYEPAGGSSSNKYYYMVGGEAGDFNQNYKNLISSASNFSDFIRKVDHNKTFLSSYTSLRSTPISSTSEASAILISLFRLTETNLTQIDSALNTQNESLYRHINGTPSPSNVGDKAELGEIYINHSYNLLFSSIVIAGQSCTPNWTAYNTSCQSNEKLTTYFIDSKNCNQATPANLSFGCDYDNNGIINSAANLSGILLSTYINYQPVNTSENYTGKKYKVELKSGSNPVLEFDWNFSRPLNLENIYLEKQPSSATRGYLIVRGLNVRKKILIDKLNSSSSSVCVKDQELNSIAGISLSCTGTNEYEINCPGSNDNFTCNLPTGFFELDGLTNSGVIEIPYRTINTSCTPNWNCTNWSSCSGRRQNRTCRDLSFCNTNMPPLNQSCSLGSCTPNWNCTAWSACTNGNQTKTCTDLNNCNIIAGKPNTKQSCTEEEKGYNWTIISIIIGIVILIIIIVILLIYFLSKGENQNNSSLSPPIPPSPTYSPPQYTSSHQTYSQNMQNQQF